MEQGLFSVITIVNDKEKFQKFRESLERQKEVKYELIVINNKNNQFNSAREAYKSGILQSQGEYLLFLHPDISFLDKYALKDIAMNIQRINDFGVIGVAGCPIGEKSYIVTSIFQGKNKEAFGTRIKENVSVQTVDECFFVMKRNVYNTIPFSNINGWHFYAVEECLKAIVIGKNNYVIPARLWHKSAGASEDKNYVETGQLIVNTYGKYFDSINTTITKWNTHGYFNKAILPWIKHWKRIMEWKLGIKE